MTSSHLQRKLNPHRYPNMSPTLGAIMGYILEREYTTPVLADVMVTTDGKRILYVGGSAIGWGVDYVWVWPRLNIGVQGIEDRRFGQGVPRPRGDGEGRRYPMLVERGPAAPGVENR